MSVSENDVKVLGRVVSIAVDGIVADAEQVYDTTVAKSQAEINAIIQGSIEDLGSNVYQTIMQLDGKIAGCQSSIQTTNSKIQAIEHDVAGKQDVLTFDNVPTANSNNPVKSGGIKSAIDNITSGIKNSLSTYQIKVLYDNNGQDEEKAIIYSNYDGFTIATRDHTDFILSALGGNIEAISSGEIVVSSNDNIGVTSNGAISITASSDNVEVSASDGNVNIDAKEEMRISSGSNMTISSEASMSLSSQEDVTLHVPNVHMPRTNDQSIVDIDSYRTNGMYILCGRDVKYKYYDSQSDSLIDGQRSLYGGGILFVQKDGYPSNVILQYLYTGQYLYHRYFEPNSTNYSVLFEKDLLN